MVSFYSHESMHILSGTNTSFRSNLVDNHPFLTNYDVQVIKLYVKKFLSKTDSLNFDTIKPTLHMMRKGRKRCLKKIFLIFSQEKGNKNP
ncbi:hypothetical protein A9C19_15560 [Bacillus weihaiensis]|uniref:Uncharacterized protein n=1 Tax=Bacillus weihaiensis TaxID=1547283 RepID=A0A1L3MUL5_9BACI|nr:hypothetical protein A9C19_15560 [Bacillus weihaiensis]